MKKNHLLAALSMLFSTFTGAQDFDWARSIGSLNTDAAISTAEDELGNLYLTGYFSSTADFDPGPGVLNLTASGVNDIFVLKLNDQGELLWARQFGGNGSDKGYDLSVDARGYALLCGTFSDTVDFDPGPATTQLIAAGSNAGFILKLDPDGRLDWVKQVNNSAINIETDLRGSVYVSGSYENTVDFDPSDEVFELTSAGASDVYILKLDWKGSFVWARSIGGTQLETADGLSVDDAGTVYTMGTFRSDADFDPGPAVFNMNSISFYSDLFVQKMDTEGHFIWAKQIGGSYFQFGNDIKTNALGDVLLTGTFSETTDFDPGPENYSLTATGYDIFVLSLSAEGNLNWAYQVVGQGNLTDTGESLAVDLNGNVYVCGNFLLTADFKFGPTNHYLVSAGSEDCFIMKLNSSGAFIWAFRVGGTGQDQCQSIFLDPHGNIYTVGSFSTTVDFNPFVEVSNLISNGASDIFIQKWSQNWNFTGRLFSDANANGTQDTDELGWPNAIVYVPERDLATTTDSTGSFRIYSNIVGDSVYVIKQRPYWTVTPAVAVADTTETPLHFGITVPYAPDLCLLAINTTPFRPGFMTEVVVQVVNTGTVPIDSALVELLIVMENPPGPLEFVEAFPTVQVISSDDYAWKTGLLAPDEIMTFRLILRTPETMPLNTPLTLSTTIGPENDVYPDNNRSRFSTTVVASLDPNDKQVSPPDLLAEQLDTSALQYVIRFQNTGNYPAEFVVIRDTLSADLDLATLQVYGASHPFTWRIYDERVLEFRFDPIFLPDSISDEPRSHGFTLFGIKARKGLVAGDSIANRAGIYFDYNEPVITPEAVFRVRQLTHTQPNVYGSEIEFGLSPNPVSRNAPISLTLPTNLTGKDAFVAVYDQQGKLVRQLGLTAIQGPIYLSSLPAGMYVVWVEANGVWGWKTLVVK